MSTNNKSAAGLAILFEIILVATSITCIVLRQWKDFFLTLFAIVCLILPFGVTRIAHRKRIELPSSFQRITLIFIFLAQYLGEIKKFYLIFWWWDLSLHAISGSYAVIVALYFIKGSIRKEHETTDQRFSLFTAIFAFNFSITLGTLWEMFEFIGDYLLKSNMVKGGLEDTATDLLVKILAALITAILCYYRSLRKRKYI